MLKDLTNGMTLEDRIRDVVEGDDLIQMVQAEVSYYGNLEAYLAFPMDELGDHLDGYTPERVLDMAFYGSFNPNHDYFRFDGYANLETMYHEDLVAELEDSVNEIIEDWLELPYSDRKDLMEEWEIEEE